VNWRWLQDRLGEPTTWLGVATFFGSFGSALASAGLTKAGLIVGAVGAGFGGVGAFVTREHKQPPPEAK